MTKELYGNLKEKELGKMGQIKANINEESFKVTTGVCPTCNVKMEKIVENKSLFDGTITFHIIKFKCSKCKKEFLDLEQAEKYDWYLLLEKFSNKATKNLGMMMNKLKVLVKV